jgi:hypothetical protein
LVAGGAFIHTASRFSKAVIIRKVPRLRAALRNVPFPLERCAIATWRLSLHDEMAPLPASARHYHVVLPPLSPADLALSEI